MGVPQIDLLTSVIERTVWWQWKVISIRLLRVVPFEVVPNADTARFGLHIESERSLIVFMARPETITP